MSFWPTTFMPTTNVTRANASQPKRSYDRVGLERVVSRQGFLAPQPVQPVEHDRPVSVRPPVALDGGQLDLREHRELWDHLLAIEPRFRSRCLEHPPRLAVHIPRRGQWQQEP